MFQDIATRNSTQVKTLHGNERFRIRRGKIFFLWVVCANWKSCDEGR